MSVKVFWYSNPSVTDVVIVEGDLMSSVKRSHCRDHIARAEEQFAAEVADVNSDPSHKTLPYLSDANGNDIEVSSATPHVNDPGKQQLVWPWLLFYNIRGC